MRINTFRAPRLIIVLLLGVLVSVLAACSPLTLVNAIGQDDGISRVETYAYGDLERQQLDVYFPKKSNDKLVFFIYGGSWMSGDKAEYRFVARNLTRQGFTVVIADYRLYPEVRFPVFVEDSAQALAWTRTQLGRWSVKENGVFVVGHVGTVTPFIEWLGNESVLRRMLSFFRGEPLPEQNKHVVN